MSEVASKATLGVLDFPAVLRALAGQAQTAMGHARLAALAPLADRAAAEQRHEQVDEFRHFLARSGGLSLAAAVPLDDVLRSASVAGTVLDRDEMLAAYRTAQVNERVRRQLNQADDLPLLAAVGAQMADLGALVAHIDKVFDGEGNIKDSASPQLASLRGKKRRSRHRLIETLGTLVKGDDLDGVLRDRIVTQRGGRFVVPVRAGRKGSLPGVVHDASSSGQTVYVEPLASVEQQNELVELDRAESEEVRRLLADLTAHVGALAGALAAAQQAIEELDVRQAIAGFAGLTDGVRPVFSTGALELRGARHPLMVPEVIRLRDDIDASDIDASDVDASDVDASDVDASDVDARDGDARDGDASDGDVSDGNASDGNASDGGEAEPVPLDLTLDADTRTLVITGPNTGGKTVALKAVGLASLLAQCGVPVPAAVARLPFRPRVHADIGDEQSIVASLSTFSSHLTRIKRFLDDSPAGSLVLLDELGAGTDPAEGAALGIAVLEGLAAMRTTTIASTHHDALKAFAHATEGVVNAAMEFNSETLQPTYRLRLGLPGRSNAFDIAARLGLDAGIVDRARGLIGADTAHLDSLIRSVEGEAEALATDRQGVHQEQHRLAQAHARYDALNRRLGDVRARLESDGRAAVEEALATIRVAGETLLDELAGELGDARKSRAAQDRRAAWAAKVAAAESGARRKLEQHSSTAVRLQAAAEGAAPASPVAADPAAEMVDDDRPDTPLSRGDAVLVMPLRLRGRVARDWAGDDGDDDRVEVDVQGKRLIVARRQVRRRKA